MSSMDSSAPTPQDLPILPVNPAGSSQYKEVEPTPQVDKTQGIKEIGKESQLAPEMTGAGVKVHPTTINIPPNITKMGVASVGQSTPPPAVTVTLPLTDDQIAQGLKKDMTSSWRWLAEWCMRKIKQIHRALVKSS